MLANTLRGGERKTPAPGINNTPQIKVTTAMTNRILQIVLFSLLFCLFICKPAPVGLAFLGSQSVWQRELHRIRRYVSFTLQSSYEGFLPQNAVGKNLTP